MRHFHRHDPPAEKRTRHGERNPANCAFPCFLRADARNQFVAAHAGADEIGAHVGELRRDDEQHDEVAAVGRGEVDARDEVAQPGDVDETEQCHRHRFDPLRIELLRKLTDEHAKGEDE